MEANNRPAKPAAADKTAQAIQRLYGALATIARYQSTDHLRKHSHRDWGVGYEEALEMAYENVQETARQAIKGVRLPKPTGTITRMGLGPGPVFNAEENA